jgi:hypothetical protein
VHLRLEPPAPRGLQLRGREVAEQRVRIGDELLGRERLLLFHTRSRLRRPVVGLDQLVDVLPDAQAELEVALDDVHRSNNAACPCPTPTQSVASP